MMTVREAILHVLSNADHPLGTPEIAERLPEIGVETTDQNLRQELSALARSGEVTRPRRGRYLLVPGSGAVAGRSTPGPPPTLRAAALQARLRETVRLTLYTEVCAGGGSYVFDEASGVVVEIPRALVVQFLGFDPPPAMGVSQVEGDSMEPLMEDGDLVLYDLVPSSPGSGIYVVNYDERVAVKRLQPYGRGWRLIPENRAAGYVEEVVTQTEEGWQHHGTGGIISFGVVGRVVFPRRHSSRLHVQQVAELLRAMFREAATGA